MVARPSNARDNVDGGMDVVRDLMAVMYNGARRPSKTQESAVKADPPPAPPVEATQAEPKADERTDALAIPFELGAHVQRPSSAVTSVQSLQERVRQLHQNLGQLEVPEMNLEREVMGWR